MISVRSRGSFLPHSRVNCSARASGAPARSRNPGGCSPAERQAATRGNPKADYQRNLEDARALSKLAGELKADLEKSDYNILSVGTLKKTEYIDRLAKRIRDRLKRF